MTELVEREDLAALIEMLQHEHFSYTETGQRAARARKALEAALRRGGRIEIVGGRPPGESRAEFERDRMGETGDRLAAATATALARELTPPIVDEVAEFTAEHFDRVDQLRKDRRRV